MQILDLDWSPGLINLKCVDRVDLALHGSFADVIALSDPYEADINDSTSLFLLTNPGQLHFYDYPSLSTFKSGLEKNQSVHAVQYHSIIPTVEPCMTVGKLFLINSEAIFSRTVSEVLDTLYRVLILALFILMISYHFIRQIQNQHYKQRVI